MFPAQQFGPEEIASLAAHITRSSIAMLLAMASDQKGSSK